MGQDEKNLKDVIDHFLNESAKTVDQVKKNHRPLTSVELESLAERIWELRHYAIELLEKTRDETTWYNASIIRELTDQPLQIDSKTTLSLIEAADEVKRLNKVHALSNVVKALAEEDTLRDVLFGDLEQISRELAA